MLVADVVLDRVLEPGGARLDYLRRGIGRVGRDEENFARRLGLGGDQQVAPSARAGDGEEETLVVLLKDERVGAGVGAELVPPHLERSDGVVGPDEWDDIFVSAGYAQFLWPDLAQTFAGWANESLGDPVVQAYMDTDGPGDDNEFAMYLATSCTDAPWKGNDWLADNWRTYYKAPLLTWDNAWFNAPCFSWRAKAGKPVHVTGAGVGDALLIDETRDAATPYVGSLYVRKIFRSSRLVATIGGTSHAVSPSGNPCVDNKIFNYLAKGTLPRRKSGGGADVKCRALPRPTPAPPTESFGAGSSLQTLDAAANSGDAVAGRLLVNRLVLAANRFSR